MSLADRIKVRPVTWRRRPEILLCPNVPKPMHGVAPREILGGRWWDETRQAAYRSTAFHCVACGVAKFLARFHRWLEGHELYEIDYLKGRMTYLETVSPCHLCHNYIHSGRLQALLDKGEINQAKYAAVIQHGDAVLAAAGLVKPPQYDGPIAGWSRWRLVLNGKLYPPKYKTMQDWEQAFDV